jgi:hypothetical protein
MSVPRLIVALSIDPATREGWAVPVVLEFMCGA